MIYRLISLAVISGALSFAQTGAGLGSLAGTVRDATGAVVPNAKILVSNDERGIKREVQSNSSGGFQVLALSPGAGYSLNVSASGFAEFARTGLAVSVGEGASIEVTLAVAGSATQVSVNETLESVDDQKSAVSNVVGSQEIGELPINGRRFDSFVLLTPGVSNDGTFGLVTFRGMAGGNSFLTDGTDTTNQFFNEAPGRTRIRSQISQDAVQEFQVIAAGYLPEFGRASGGVVNTVTKGGTNQLHGSAFWYFRNRTLNARDRYAAFNPPETQYQSGSSFGGALKKDKLFYFASTEILRRNFPIAASYARPGVVDSGHFIGCGAPANPAQCAAIDSILSRQYGQVSRRADSENFFAKLDWHPSDRDTVSASGNYLRFLSPNGIQSAAALNTGAAVGNNADSTVRDRYGRLLWTRVIPSRVLNEARFGFFKDRQYDDISQSLTPSFGYLTLTVNGATNLGAANSYPRLNPSELRFQYADTLSASIGKHSTKFGIDVSNTRDVTDQTVNRYGTYTYGTVTAFAQDFSGNVTAGKRWQTFSQAFGTPRVDETIRDWGFFAQDQYRTTSRLTLNYGVRYDVAQLPQPSIVNPDYRQTGRIPGYKGGLAPRLGFAYSFGKDHRTVLRAGWGLFTGRYGTGIINSLFLNNGVYQKSVSYTGTNAADNAAGPVWPNRLTASEKVPGTIDITFASDSWRSPYAQNGDITVEREIARRTTLAVSYLYNRGFQLTTIRDLNIGAPGPVVTYTIQDAAGKPVGTYSTPTYRTANRVDSRYRHVNQVENGGKSWYDGLAVDLRGQVKRDLSYRLSYTWSHAIDLGQGSGGDTANLFASSGPSLNNLSNGDYRADKGNGALDQRHRLSLSFVARHDFWRSNAWAARAFANGWQLSGILTLASGRPTFATVNIQALVTGLPFFTLNGFGGDTRVPFLPVNPVQLDATKKVDARLTKDLRVKDRYRVSMVFEAFNITNSPYNTNINHTAYNASGTALTPAPGFATGTASAGFPDGTNVRRAQVNIRLGF